MSVNTGGKSGGNSGTAKPATTGRRPGTFQPGQDRRRGRGPAAGAPNAGRPPEKFKAKMQDLANQPAALKRLKKILGGSAAVTDRAFLAAHRYVTERGYGKVPTVIEGGDERKPLVIRLVREGKQ